VCFLFLNSKTIGIITPLKKLQDKKILEQIEILSDQKAKTIIFPEKTIELTKENKKDKLFEDQALDLSVVFAPSKELLNRLASLLSSNSSSNSFFNQIIIALETETIVDSTYLKLIFDLFDKKGIFFVPFGFKDKFNSDNFKESTMLISRIDLLSDTCRGALKNIQLKPLFIEGHF